MSAAPPSEPAPRSAFVGVCLFVIKAAISLALIWYILRDVPLDALWRRVQEADPGWLLLSLFLLCVMTFLAAWRWWLITPYAEARLTFRRALHFLLVGQFFNQTLPSSVGGDAFRVWLVKGTGKPLGVSLATVALDRLFGLLALIWTAALGAIYATSWGAVSAQPIDGIPRTVFWSILGFAVAGLVAIAMLTLIGRRRGHRTRQAGWLSVFHRIACAVFSIVRRWSVAVATLVTSIAVHLLVGLAAAMIFSAIGVTVDLGYAIAAVSVVMLVTVIPISLGGWGVRETAMIAVFAPMGIAAADSLFVSVTLGLGMFIVGLPGGGLWLTGSRRTAT